MRRALSVLLAVSTVAAVAVAAPVLLPATRPGGRPTMLPANPFPRPKLLQVSPDMRSATGVLVAVDPAAQLVILQAAPGLLNLSAGVEVRVAAADGRPLPGLASLAAGAQVRVYYTVEGSARALEIDLEPEPATAATAPATAPAPAPAPVVAPAPAAAVPATH